MRGPLILTLCLCAAPASASLSPYTEGSRALFLPLVQREATLQGVPPALADAVAMVETAYHPDATGTSGEIGLMQIMPATARQLGFTGAPADLYQPATNVRLGVQYLSRAWAASGGSVCRALMKYRAGLGEEQMTPLSTAYCARALAWLATSGSDLGRGTPLATPALDPYVIALGPTPKHLPQIIVPQQAAFFRTFRTMADRNAALHAQSDPHVRHIPTSATVQDAVASALAAD